MRVRGSQRESARVCFSNAKRRPFCTTVLSPPSTQRPLQVVIIVTLLQGVSPDHTPSAPTHQPQQLQRRRRRRLTPARQGTYHTCRCAPPHHCTGSEKSLPWLGSPRTQSCTRSARAHHNALLGVLRPVPLVAMTTTAAATAAAVLVVITVVARRCSLWLRSIPPPALSADTDTDTQTDTERDTHTYTHTHTHTHTLCVSVSLCVSVFVCMSMPLSLSLCLAVSVSVAVAVSVIV